MSPHDPNRAKIHSDGRMQGPVWSVQSRVVCFGVCLLTATGIFMGVYARWFM